MAAPPKPLDSGTRLAADRTRLAYERTLMAWVRTATSLISFGFTIYKFFEFEAGRNLPAATSHFLSPRSFGMIMISTGLIALLFSAIDHHRSVKVLDAEYGMTQRSTASVVAAIVAGMGLLALAESLL